MIRLPTNPVTLPDVPDAVRTLSPELADYLERFKLVIQQNASGAQANVFVVAKAINSGTSGAFLIASGGHLNLTSGIVISVSTT